MFQIRFYVSPYYMKKMYSSFKSGFSYMSTWRNNGV